MATMDQIATLLAGLQTTVTALQGDLVTARNETAEARREAAEARAAVVNGAAAAATAPPPTPSSAFGTGSATFTMGSAGSELLKLGKPSKYEGGQGFMTWRDSLIDYTKLMDKRLSDAMVHIEQHLNGVQEIPQPTDEDDAARSETLRYMLPHRPPFG